MKSVFILSLDRTKILEADLNKLNANKPYFLSKEDAVCYLLLMELENLVDNFLIKNGYNYNVNLIKETLNRIETLNNKNEYRLTEVIK